jgi:GC-rich sequence DNA-binding factor
MSKQRSIRKKIATSDDDSDEQGSLAAPPASIRALQQQRNKEKKTGEKKSLLSFVDDAAAGVSEAAHTLKARPTLRAPGVHEAAPSATTQVSGAGEYTVERLQELRRGTLKPPGGGASLATGGIKIAGSFKPAGTAADGGVDARGVLSSAAMPLPPPTAAPPPSSVTHTGIGSDREEDDEDEDDGGNFIPNADVILRAKAKRERLRSAHLAPDYIPTASVPGLERLRALRVQENDAIEDGVEGKRRAGSSEGEGEEGEGARTMFGLDRREGRSVLAAAAAEGAEVKD